MEKTKKNQGRKKGERDPGTQRVTRKSRFWKKGRKYN